MRQRNGLVSETRAWFEVRLIEGTAGMATRKRLAQVARREGHRTSEVETDNVPDFLAVCVLARSPRAEMERLLRLAGVEGACQEVEEW